MKKLHGSIILLLALLLCASGGRAQNAISTGSISGQVTDPSDEVVQNVTVMLTSDSEGLKFTTKTNGTGFFSFASLPVGAYELTSSQTGFKTAAIHNLQVQVGQNTAANLRLELGNFTESVMVTAEQPLMRTTESTNSTVLNQNLIDNLPLSGRRYTDFVLLTPNVTADGDFGLVSMAGQQGGADSGYANGNGSNSFTVDGANASSNYFGEARGRTRVPYVFGEQSVQEFQVTDNPYNAAYGGAGAGFVNTVTKSGTDQWHGDAFYYNRNSGVGNADDAIDMANGVPRPLDVLQQFGADLGGPVVQHTSWFYFDYEQQRRLEPISVLNSTLSSAFEPANLTSTFGVPTGTSLPSPNASLPAPVDFVPSSPFLYSAMTPGEQAEYLQGVANAVNAFDTNLGQRARRADNLSFFPKLDWQLTSADYLTLVYNYSRFNSPGGEITFNPVPEFGTEALSNNYVRDHHASAHWTHTFSPSLLNDVSFSYLRDEQIETPSGLTSPTLGQIVFFSPSFFELGNPTFAVGDNKEYQWQLNDHLTYITGRHTLSFGFDYDHTHVTDFLPSNFDGTYAFNNPEQFALGLYHSFTQAAGDPFFPFSFPYYGFYLQDKYQAFKNLTLDFGVREDFQVFPQPKPNTTTGVPIVAQLTGQFPNQYKRISPRVGFSYQPFAKTVVRGGFGIFREILDGINYENSEISDGLVSRQSSTFVSFNSSLPPNRQTPVFPAALTNTSSFGASSNLTIVDPGFQTPYILESNLEIQNELATNTTISVGTMWTHGVHLLASSAFDENLIAPTGTATYYFCPPEAGLVSGATNPTTAMCNLGKVTAPNLDGGLLTEGRLTSAVGQINALISPGVNNYNSLYVQIRRRATRGLTLETSYTFSHATQTSADFNNQFDFSDAHGPTLLDQRHRLTVGVVYAHGTSGLSDHFYRFLLSNWTVSSVMQFNSGRPYTGLLNSACTGPNLASCGSSGNDTLNDSAINESTGNTAEGIAGAGPVPGEEFNSFYGPWIDEIDLGLTRAFHITERQKIEFQAQVFNLFNHPNYFVQAGSGVIQTRYNPVGPNCGDGANLNQTCFLVPNPPFQTLQSIDQLNGPRTFQFVLRYSF